MSSDIFRVTRAPAPVRIYTNAIMELMDNGLMNPQKVAEACLHYMSEDDVKEMLQANDMMVFLEAMDAVKNDV